MVTDRDLERRCRYRLAKHGLRFHKVAGNAGPVYYVYEDGGDDTIPEDGAAFMTLNKLLAYCEELAEREADKD